MVKPEGGTAKGEGLRSAELSLFSVLAKDGKAQGDGGAPARKRQTGDAQAPGFDLRCALA